MKTLQLGKLGRIRGSKFTVRDRGSNVYLLDVDKLAVLVLEQCRDEQLQHVLHARTLHPEETKRAEFNYRQRADSRVVQGGGERNGWSGTREASGGGKRFASL
jgi:hypothetical protein